MKLKKALFTLALATFLTPTFVSLTTTTTYAAANLYTAGPKGVPGTNLKLYIEVGRDSNGDKFLVDYWTTGSSVGWIESVYVSSKGSCVIRYYDDNADYQVGTWRV